MNNPRHYIHQAVILAGGRGERLRPITDNTPKPMAPIDTRPFLWFLCDQLISQGFLDIIILGGYLGGKIEEWARNNPLQNRAKLTVIISPEEWDPLMRIRHAEGRLAERFALLYGDNFSSFRFEKMKLFHSSHDKSISLLISQKTPGNIVRDTNSIQYLKQRSSSASHVDLGFMAIEKKSFLLQSSTTETLSECLAELGKINQLNGLEHKDRYYSISDPLRYAETVNFLRPKRILLLDRDGTVNKKPEEGKYVTSAAELQIIPEAKSGIMQLSQAGFSFAIVSNQAGIATGDLSVEALEEINLKLHQEFMSVGAKLLGIYICPVHWKDKDHQDRKPQAGMFFQLSKELQLRLDNLLYVGDDVRDMQAAWNANCLSAYIGDPRDLNNLPTEQQPKFSGMNLEALAPYIIEFYSSSRSET